MVIASKIPPRSTIVPRDELLTAAKAIHDELKTVLEDRLQEVEVRLGVRLGKSLKQETGDQKEEVDKHRSEVELQLVEMTKRCEQLVASMQNSFESTVKTIQEEMDKRIELLQRTYETGWDRLESMLKAMPVPQVILPEKSIDVRVDQVPSVVNLPEGVIRLQVDNRTPDIVVNVPQQETPVVHVAAADVTVNVPQQGTPQVQVNVPPPRLTKKTFAYDQNGRPDSVLEQEI